MGGHAGGDAALASWLEPAPGSRGTRTDVLGAVASLVFLDVAAGVFALLTT